MYNDSTKEATMKYMKEKRDKLTLSLPKGKKEAYKAFAESQGMSLTELIMTLIENKMNEEQ